MKPAPMMRVPGYVWLPTDEPGPANRRNAGTALVTSPGTAIFSSGDFCASVDAFCGDRDCPDYKRADFPADRPHYHVGKRVFAPVEIKFAESQSKTK